MNRQSANSEASFDSALSTVIPILHQMTKNLRPAPKASLSSVERLRSASPPKSHSEAVSIIPTGKAFENPMIENGLSSTKHTPDNPVNVKNDGRLAKLDSLKKSILACTRCANLVATRTQVVYGVGNPFAELLFVGEAPGEEEDLRGEPFVGRAGQLLSKIIGAMEFTREDIFIANVLKCRPDMPSGESGNRKPKPTEMATCLPWLTQQIDLIKPKVIVALGLTAVEGLLGEPRTMREVRGRWLDYRGVPLMPT